VTAKGYPDFATRHLLSILSGRGIEMFYLGDADPHGAEIYFIYLFGSLKGAINAASDRCQTLFELTWLGPFLFDLSSIGKRHLLSLTKTDQLKAYSLLSKPYLSDQFLKTPTDCEQVAQLKQ
jgi:DNA topoisomerase VI subunit A